MNLQTVLSPRRRLLALCLLAPLALGCPSGGGQQQLSGNVTLNGDKVAGTLVLVGADGKEYPGPILNGKYLVPNVPKGDYDVLIRPAPGATGLAAPKKDAGTLGSETQGVAPPEKYSKAGVLEKVKVTGGQQTKDFTLSP